MGDTQVTKDTRVAKDIWVNDITCVTGGTRVTKDSWVT